MKKLVLFLMFAVFTTSALLAQDKQKHQRATPEERAKNQTERLTKALDLTADQQTKVYDINLKYSQPKDQKKDSTTTREQRMEEFKKIATERNDAIKAVLTDAQKTKFDEYQKEMMEKMKEGRKKNK